MTPSFPTVLKKGRSGRTPVFNGMVLPQNLNELEIPKWDKEVMDCYKELVKEFDTELQLPMQTSSVVCPFSINANILFTPFSTPTFI